MRTEKAAEIFAAAGNDFQKARTAAALPGFRPLTLDSRITMQVHNRVRQFESQNILGNDRR